jgi:hypothetical protein
VRLVEGDALNETVAGCGETCRGSAQPLPDLVGSHAGEKGLTWVGEPLPENGAAARTEDCFPFYPLALQVARLAGLSEDELVLCALPRCRPAGDEAWDRDAAAERCRIRLQQRLRQPKVPPTIVAVGRLALVNVLAAVRELTGEEPAFGSGAPEEGPAERGEPGPFGDRAGRFHFRAAEYRVVPLPVSLAPMGTDNLPGRLLVEFSANLGRLCRVTLYDQALDRIRELVPLAFREKVDASGSTYFTPGNHRLFRILRRPRELAAEFYAPRGAACFVYRGTDLDHLLELVVDTLTQAIG